MIRIKENERKMRPAVEKEVALRRKTTSSFGAHRYEEMQPGRIESQLRNTSAKP